MNNDLSDAGVPSSDGLADAVADVGTDRWTIQDVVKMSGVTSRTLRHYDEIALLVPASRLAGGIRAYDRDDLLRLQQIMVLRELELSLADIRSILDGQKNQLTALRDQLDRIGHAAARMERVRTTINSTINDIEGVRSMKASELFEGFDPEKQQSYEAELVDRFGPEMQERIDETWRRIAVMSRDDAAAVNQGYVDFEVALTQLLQSGAEPVDAEVQSWISLHHEIVSKFWTPDATSYAGLGDMYVSHPDFKARYDAHDERLAEFLRDAMAVFAARRLGGE